MVASFSLLPCKLILAQTQVERVQKNASEKPLRYLLYVPKQEAPKPLPLVLFLHGGGEGGQNIEKVKKHGPPKLVAEGKVFPFILLSPQNPSDTQFWDDQELIRLLDEMQSEFPVDQSRVYLTGLSRGAYGAWRLAIQNPDRFAAVIPICGGGPLPYIHRLKSVPIWAFHGAKDNVIPISESRRLVESLRASRGTVKFTVYPDAKHDSWTQTYNNPKVYDWLLSQQRPPSGDK